MRLRRPTRETVAPFPNQGERDSSPAAQAAGPVKTKAADKSATELLAERLRSALASNAPGVGPVTSLPASRSAGGSGLPFAYRAARFASTASMA